MPEELENGVEGGVAGAIAMGDAGGETLEEGEGSSDAVQEVAAGSCEEVAEALAAENESLRARVAELESALAGVEGRFELERALVDAGVIDLETALAVAGGRVESGEEPGAVVAEMVGSKPFLFRSPRSRGAGSALGGAAAERGSTLSGLADEARKSGDRRALTRYLRKRRGG